MDGNFDRVMALIGCVIGMQETHNQYTNLQEQELRTNDVKKFLTNNSYIFPNASGK